MRILFALHLFPPHHLAGSELSVLALAQFLQKKGHDVRVLKYDAPTMGIDKPYQCEGVDVYPPSAEPVLFDWCSVVFCQLDYTSHVIQKAYKLRKFVFYWAHSDINVPPPVYNNPEFVRVIYNTNWVADKLNYLNKSFTLHPPIDRKRYHIMERPMKEGSITLINLSENKGARVFYRIANAMPDHDFMGVKGSYDTQIVVRGLQNVAIVNKTNNIAEIYRMTRILLVPSEYESFGRVALEAACNGIPVICSDTPGLREAMGDAAIYCDRYNLTEWVDAIKSLEDGRTFNARVKAVKERFALLNFEGQLEQFNTWLTSTIRQ